MSLVTTTSSASLIYLGGAGPIAYGGLGDDTIDAGDSGKAEVYGDSGVSTILGGDDVIIGRDATSLDAYGDGGADTICGTSGDDILDGGTGNDLLWSYAETSEDAIDGAGGSDTCGGDGTPTTTNCETVASSASSVGCP